MAIFNLPSLLQERESEVFMHTQAGRDGLSDIALFASRTFPRSLSPTALAERDLPLASPTRLSPENKTQTQFGPQPATYICEEQE